MQDDTLLQRIQRLQFDNRGEAEALLLAFIRETFPQLGAHRAQLRPQAVSLNSFNGYLWLDDGRQLFFKTHVEQDNVIGEYYNAALLAQAGYPVIQPLYSSTRYGQQLLIYDLVHDPSVFDVARELERQPSEERLRDLTTAQNAADDALYQAYVATLQPQTADEAAGQPIHQLFYHRLTGGRLDRFYGQGVVFDLPGRTVPAGVVRSVQWVINDVAFAESLDDIIRRAVALLQPAQAQPSVIGHGDAHNGNVFYMADGSLTYFDPAFAGRHHPLLDLTKPLFHNVYAMWMYFPDEERDALSLTWRQDGDTWVIDHNFAVNPVRQMFLDSKVARTLTPLIAHLRSRGELRPDWREYLKAALFCCPLLTLNLTQFPPEIGLLGLTMAVEFGAVSAGNESRIDRLLDEVERLTR